MKDEMAAFLHQQIQRHLAAPRTEHTDAIVQALCVVQAYVKQFPDDVPAMKKIGCSRCGKPVSTLVPIDTLVGAFVECPACSRKQQLSPPVFTRSAGDWTSERGNE